MAEYTTVTQGKGNKVNVGNKKSTKISISIGTVVVVAIVAVVAIWLGGNGGSPSKAIVGDWAASTSDFELSFYDDGTVLMWGDRVGRYTVRSDNALYMEFASYDETMTFKWSENKGEDYWYILGNTLSFDGEILNRVK